MDEVKEITTVNEDPERRGLHISATAKVMCASLAALCAFFLAAGISVSLFLYPFEPTRAYASGLLTGSLLSAVKIVLMERMLNRAADSADSASAKNYGALSVVFRNVLTLGVLLIVFFFRDIFGMFGAIIGVLLIQPAAFVTGFIMRKDK